MEVWKMILEHDLPVIVVVPIESNNGARCNSAASSL
jgi:hypothetical protein